MKNQLSVVLDEGGVAPYVNLPDPEKIESQREYTRNWIWRAVAALIDLEDFKGNLSWVCERLNISKAEAAGAIEGLEALGIIQKTTNGYQRVLKYVYYGPRDLTGKELVESHVLISQQILTRIDVKNTEGMKAFKTGFLSTNKKLTKEFNENVEALIKEYLKKSSNEPADEVMALTFSNIEISKPLRGNT